MEKSSVLRFIFILVFIGTVTFPLTYFSVKKFLGSHNHPEHRHGYSAGVRVVRHTNDDDDYDNIEDKSQRHNKRQTYNSNSESDYSSNVVSDPSQIPNRTKRKNLNSKLITPPYIHLSDEMRNSIETQQYTAHAVSCFDQITKNFYICDNRIQNSQLSCPIIYPGHKIQIISENHEVYHNITRETTSCFIMWFNHNPENFSSRKITVDDVMQAPKYHGSPSQPPSPYRTHPTSSPSTLSKK
jgi:hypothetical protein